MASIRKEMEIDRSKEFVWDAIRDVGAIHKRLVPFTRRRQMSRCLDCGFDAK
jgi:hypothetical protein